MMNKYDFRSNTALTYCKALPYKKLVCQQSLSFIYCSSSTLKQHTCNLFLPAWPVMHVLLFSTHRQHTHVTSFCLRGLLCMYCSSSTHRQHTHVTSFCLRGLLCMYCSSSTHKQHTRNLLLPAWPVTHVLLFFDT